MAAPSRSTSPLPKPSFNLTPKQHEAQRVLAGPQRNTLLVGGARSGKTFLITRAIVIRALRAPKSRHAIVRFRMNAVRAAVWLDTLPKVMSLCFPGVKLTDNRQDGYAELPNGSHIWFGGLDDKERVEKILGLEFSTIYFNEASQIPLSSYQVTRTRLAQVCEGLRQREYVDLNPSGTGHWAYRQFIQQLDPDSKRPLADPENYAAFYLNPKDNAQNLSPEFLRSLETLPERHRKRFYEGIFVPEIDGALWTFELIERCRYEGDVSALLPALRRVVVAIDPSGTSGKDDARNDSVGIAVVGLGFDGNAYVLADRSCNLSPAGWGRRAVEAYHEFKADCIVAESNFGGAMVEHVIKTADVNVPCRMVTASRGKAVRAEPVSSLYEAGRVFHVGRFADLEDQLSNFSTNGYQGDKSPDRADAMIWGVTELLLGQDTTGIIEFYRRELDAAPKKIDVPASTITPVQLATYAPAQIMMKAPGGISIAFGLSGTKYTTNPDGTILVTVEEDVGPLRAAGFTELRL